MLSAYRLLWHMLICEISNKVLKNLLVLQDSSVFVLSVESNECWLNPSSKFSFVLHVYMFFMHVNICFMLISFKIIIMNIPIFPISTTHFKIEVMSQYKWQFDVIPFTFVNSFHTSIYHLMVERYNNNFLYKLSRYFGKSSPSNAATLRAFTLLIGYLSYSKVKLQSLFFLHNDPVQWDKELHKAKPKIADLRVSMKIEIIDRFIVGLGS